MAYYDLQNVTALVVEDSGFMAKLLQTLLHGLAIGRIETCTDPTRVLEFVRDVQPDVIFLDKEMPEVDGLDVARDIRTSEDTPNPFVPIIMVTGHTKTADAIAARKAGVTEFVSKPVSAKQVYERLATCIDAGRHSARARLEPSMRNAISRYLQRPLRSLAEVEQARRARTVSKEEI